VFGLLAQQLAAQTDFGQAPRVEGQKHHMHELIGQRHEARRLPGLLGLIHQHLQAVSGFRFVRGKGKAKAKDKDEDKDEDQGCGRISHVGNNAFSISLPDGR